MGPSNPSGYLDLCGLCSRMLQKKLWFLLIKIVVVLRGKNPKGDY